MLKTLYQFFSRGRQPAPSALCASEPERLKDWRAEVEFEERRRWNIAIANRIAEREEREYRTALGFLALLVATPGPPKATGRVKRGKYRTGSKNVRIRASRRRGTDGVGIKT